MDWLFFVQIFVCMYVIALQVCKSYYSVLLIYDIVELKRMLLFVYPSLTLKSFASDCYLSNINHHPLGTSGELQRTSLLPSSLNPPVFRESNSGPSIPTQCRDHWARSASQTHHDGRENLCNISYSTSIIVWNSAVTPVPPINRKLEGSNPK